ncbi:hypothetical protein G7066_04420 [Leucobacter coleopterorum]|uniref:DUF11 domain-containing protein n=1 Tax=Leucobacter coleopterorum TaxID=2714933 RepID=A0ABX6JZ24_9MICO|nr:hypothetical protein [Leucobacter coleopterorum]QIM18089.1 hypothetical protein G7066_04420 [Leucobacter coleopterorum]
MYRSRKRPRALAVSTGDVLRRLFVRIAAFAVVAAVATGAGLVAGLTPASAATGEYTVELSAPESIAVRQGFSYNVTVLTPEADATLPATGIVLTAQLPKGLRFDSVPYGGTNVVASAPYTMRPPTWCSWPFATSPRGSARSSSP